MLTYPTSQIRTTEAYDNEIQFEGWSCLTPDENGDIRAHLFVICDGQLDYRMEYRALLLPDEWELIHAE